MRREIRKRTGASRIFLSTRRVLLQIKDRNTAALIFQLTEIVSMPIIGLFLAWTFDTIGKIRSSESGTREAEKDPMLTFLGAFVVLTLFAVAFARDGY